VAESSRRTFLKTASVGAAAVGAAAVVSPHLLGTNPVQKPATFGPLHGGPFVAWVKDVKDGEIAVMVGEQTIVHKDADLAKQLAQIAARAPQS
jgi:Ubiquitinol-cytochrome C reductase Fe-S subunit TAT signal